MSKKNLVKIFIILCFVLSPFVLNYIKLEQLIAAPTAHKHNDWTYIPSNKSGFPYFLEADYVKIKSADEEKIITLYYFDSLQLTNHEQEKAISALNILSKVKFVIITTLDSQSSHTLSIEE